MKYRGSRSASSQREADGAVRALRGRGVDDLGAVDPQQPAALLGRVLGHDAGERVALELRHHREGDARVAARRLEQRAAGLELAGRLGALDHRQRDAVLDRAGRVRALELRVEPYLRLRRDPRELDERRVARSGRAGWARPSGAARAARHRRQEDDRRALRHRRLQLVERADVLAVDVDVRVLELPLELREAGVVRSSSASPTVVAVTRHLALAAGGGAQRRRDSDLRHACALGPGRTRRSRCTR